VADARPPAGTFRCSTEARSIDELQFATASTVTNWLLVESPGAWGSDALRHSRLPDAAAAHLRRSARRHGFRVVLIRRHGRHVPDGIQVYAAHAGRDRRWLEHVHLPGPEALADADLAPLGAGEPLGIGELRDDGIYLVCTNGRHDPCCSERGRPTAGALGRRFGDRAWEVSHIGGDRFAPTVVCLPAGVYLGRVDADVAVGVVERFDRGSIDLERYRGRCAEDFPTQAAEHFLRERLGVDGVDDVRAVDTRRIRRQEEDAEVVATFDVAGAGYRGTVAVGRTREARPLTCHVRAAVRPPVYRLLAIEPAGS
jgi:hypothetical protein